MFNKILQEKMEDYARQIAIIIDYEILKLLEDK